MEKLTKFQETLLSCASKILNAAHSHSVGCVHAVTTSNDVYGLSVKIYGLVAEDIVAGKEGYLADHAPKDASSEFVVPISYYFERFKAEGISSEGSGRHRVYSDNIVYGEGMVTIASALPDLVKELNEIISEYAEEFKLYQSSPPPAEPNVIKAFEK
jgi:hypothetical protein